MASVKGSYTVNKISLGGKVLFVISSVISTTIEVVGFVLISVLLSDLYSKIISQPAILTILTDITLIIVGVGATIYSEVKLTKIFLKQEYREHPLTWLRNLIHGR